MSPQRHSTISGSRTVSSTTRESSQWRLHVVNSWIWVLLWPESAFLIPMTVVRWDNWSGNLFWATVSWQTSWQGGRQARPEGPQLWWCHSERLNVLKMTGSGLRLPVALPFLADSLPYFGSLRALGGERLPVALTPLLRMMTGQLAQSLTFWSAAGDWPLVFHGKKGLLLCDAEGSGEWNGMDVELSVLLCFSVQLLPQVDCLFFPCLVSVWLVFLCFAQVVMAQFKFPSPFSRAHLRSPQLL